VITAAGDKLWKELVGVGDSPKVKITNVQLAFTGVEALEDGQRNIEGFFNGGRDKAQDSASVQDDSHRKRPPDDLSSPPQAKRQNSDGTAPLDPNTHSPADAPDVGRDPCAFTCDRCGSRINFPADLSGLDDPEVRQDVLAALKLEHDDFHFARELAEPKIKVSRGIAVLRSDIRGKGTAKSKAQGRKDQGIAKFFSRQ
jgi:DNA polymerase eta